jgi:hypothetical protein
MTEGRIISLPIYAHIDCLNPREHGRSVTQCTYTVASFLAVFLGSEEESSEKCQTHYAVNFDMIICARSMRKEQLFCKRRDARVRCPRKFSEKLEPTLQHAGWKLMRKVARLEIHARKLSFLLYLATHRTFG